MMSFDWDEKRCICSGAATMNLHCVTSIVREFRDISRDPCRSHSPTKGGKTLKPEKWQSIFDEDGKVSGFKRALKLIMLGGVDPAIRPEVWEFLLGCYSLGSTTEYRKQLRMARRERYEELIRECQSMHSSIGTGTLAYDVGSKVMDVRTLSRDNNMGEKEANKGDIDISIQKERYSDLGNNGTDNDLKVIENSRHSAELVGVRDATLDVACDPLHDVPPDECNCFSIKSDKEIEESLSPTDSYFDFPPLPVTNLFQKVSVDEQVCKLHGRKSFAEHTSKRPMHSFHIDNNVDLIIEPNDLNTINRESSKNGSCVERQRKGQKQEYKSETTDSRRTTDAPQATIANSMHNGLTMNGDRVSEWLWTLHRIVVDVVRTDIHLDFYGDSKNMARMSDILAVYAWVDPGTGYCQGMSDLLSPFVVLYEDNADAFWCFEMLLRRLRENFQMEGPTGVMKQLQALWKILELTDTEIFAHLSLIGAESLHFAFRMLLVLFRRELSFNEALCMWEMMWAADFDEALTQGLTEHCLESLVLQLPIDPNEATSIGCTENSKKKVKTMHLDHRNDEVATSHNNGARSDFSYPFCGLTKASFWAMPNQLQICSISASTRNGNDELPVFCVAAILISNRQRIIRKTHSIDDVIKMFNDNLLKINVKRCIRMAIKLRKKYLYKMKHTNGGVSEQ